MLGQERRKIARNTALILDMVHIVIGVLIVVLGVFAFLDPEGKMFLLPLIFLLAAVLNLINGIHRQKTSGREKKKKAGAVAVIILGILLFLLSAVSAVSIWWR